MMYRLSGIFLVLVISTSILQAQLRDDIHYIEDTEHVLSIDDVSQPSFQHRFLFLTQSKASELFNRSTIWLRLVVDSSEMAQQPYALTLTHAFLDTMILYARLGSSFHIDATGFRYPMSQRDLPFSKLALRVPQDISSDTLYLRLRSESLSTHIVRLNTLDKIVHAESQKEIIHITFYLLLLVIAFIGFVLYYIQKQLVFLAFALYVLSNLFLVWSNSMYFFKWVMPDSIILMSYGYMPFLSLWWVTGAFFSYLLFDISYKPIGFRLAYYIMFAIIPLQAILSLIFGRSFGNLLYFSTDTLFLLFNCVIGIIIWKKYKLYFAIIYSAGWLAYFCFWNIWRMYLVGIVPNNHFNNNTLIVGVLSEIITVSIVTFLYYKKMLVQYSTIKSDLSNLEKSIPRLETETLNNFKSLSAREVEILSLVSKGMLDKEIADHLSLSVHTSRTYLNRVFAKLKVNNRTEAASIYNAAQIIQRN